MELAPSPIQHESSSDTYWLTRYVILRWFGFIYLIAFYVATQQLVPLVGANGLTPAPLFFQQLQAHFGSAWAGFLALPSIFWINCSDITLQVIPWIGVALSCILLGGYANALMMTVLWILYMSIVHVGQDWYGYGWEIQMVETGFLAIFLCPLLDARPFPQHSTPLPVIFLFRWLIFRIMLGSALIKLRGDSCWTDLTALYYHFETQPIPNPFSVWFHFLPHPVLQFGVIWTFVVELAAPWFAFWPRWGRYVAGLLMIEFQCMLIVSGNLAFFNWLTILPALACFDDRFWSWILPSRLTTWAHTANNTTNPSRMMTGVAWFVFCLVALLSIQPVLNLLNPAQRMNASFDPLNLVNTYGAFGTVGRERPVIIFEGSNSTNPGPATDWKEYPYTALPWNPKQEPVFIAPYQPHLDWQLWFAAMSSPKNYPWTLNLVWKLLHNDPAILGLFGGNPFPHQPPHYIRAVLYIYHFAKPNNPEHLFWNRERIGLWLPPLSTDDPELLNVLYQEGWINH